MIIVAICGYKGSGKDSAAKILSEIAKSANYNPSIFHFNDAVSNCVKDIFGLDDYVQYQEFEKSGVEYNGRFIPGNHIIEIIQTHIRDCAPDKFVQYMHSTVSQFADSQNKCIIIPDLRFKQEVLWCKQNKVNILKIKKQKSFINTLINEREIDDFLCDYIINNDSDKECLEKTLTELFVKLRVANLRS